MEPKELKARERKRLQANNWKPHSNSTRLRPSVRVIYQVNANSRSIQWSSMSENHRSISLMSLSLFTDITFGKTKGHVEVTVSARVSGWPLERSKGRGGQGKGEAITLTRRSRLMLCLKRSGRERCVWESKGLWLQTGEWGGVDSEQHHQPGKISLLLYMMTPPPPTSGV